MLRNDLLKTNDGDDIQSYVYDQDPTIRQAAAQFIYHDSFVLPEDGISYTFVSGLFVQKY